MILEWFREKFSCEVCVFLLLSAGEKRERERKKRECDEMVHGDLGYLHG